MEGPTQTAEWGAAEQWRSRPSVARLLRGLIVVMPVGVAFGLSYLVSRLYPPDRVGLNVWLWWALLAVFSLVVMAATERLARRFLPLVALLKLSLIFPDEAPSRFKSALRRGTTAQLAREVEQLRQTGELSEDTSHSEYLVWLMKSLADHDRLTRGHSERVRAYADLIAEEMGLPAEDRQKLHWAALLHDVGKLDVPSDVLNKDGLPDEHEWALIAEHPAASIPYLAPLRPWLGEWASVADEHHERWDGQGYPNGLAKTEISRGGRIVAVADAFDVMTSTRSYKKAMSAEDARSEIATRAGTQFDPAVTRAFLNVGLGKLRLAAGSFGWLGHTFGLEGVTVGTVAAPASSVAAASVQTAASVLAVTAGVALAPIAEPPSDPPAAVAYEDVGVVAADEALVAAPVTVPVSVTDDFADASSSTTISGVTVAPVPQSVVTTTVSIAEPSTTPATAPTVASSAAPPSSTTTTTEPASSTTTAAPPVSTTAAPTTSTSTTAPTTTTTTTTMPTTTTTTAPPNAPPVVTKPAHQEVPAGADFSIQIDAFDPEGLPLSYSATNLPPGLGIDSATGLISGFIPGEESGIDYHVSVHVSDGERTRTVKFWIDIL